MDAGLPILRVVMPDCTRVSGLFWRHADMVPARQDSNRLGALEVGPGLTRLAITA